MRYGSEQFAMALTIRKQRRLSIQKWKAMLDLNKAVAIHKVI